MTEEMDLLDIGHKILEDGNIDAEEVEMMRASIIKDGAIDQEEAEMLFAINDALEDGGVSCPEYETFFIEMISIFLLSDEMSDGSLDDVEWDWLSAMISEDEELGPLEVKLLAHLAENSTSVPEGFADFAKRFEEIEYEDQNTSRMTFLANYIGGVLEGKVRHESSI